jgi:hypothetical protein
MAVCWKWGEEDDDDDGWGMKCKVTLMPEVR